MMHELQPGDPRLIGPYRLCGRLGAGGMGQVFLGLSAGGRPVAVKVVRAHLATDPEFRERFRREITVARTVSGLYTAPVIDADVDGPVPWLATEYVRGPSLAGAVSEHGPLPAAPVLALAGAGAADPATGWLPEPVTRTFIQVPAGPDAPPYAPPTATAAVLPPPGGATRRQPALGQSGRRPRRHAWRPLAVTSIAVGLLAGCTYTGVALTGSSGHPPGTQPGSQPCLRPPQRPHLRHLLAHPRR